MIYKRFLLILSTFVLTLASAEILSLAGDSTVASYSSSSSKQGWGYSLSKFVRSNLNVKNFAKGGRTTKTFRDEGLWKKLLSSKPDFVFLQFAHNDSKAMSISQFKANLRRYVDESHQKGIEIYFVTPPRRCRFKNGKATTELADWANALKAVAKEKDIVVLDLYKRSGDFLNKQGTKACKTYYLSSSDTTHFNKKGSELMASFVALEAKKEKDLFKYFK